MNNYKNCAEIDEINSQLERALIQKDRLLCNINREYELYLNLVRDLLYISVEKGLNELFTYSSIKDNFLNAKELFYIFDNKIRKLIYAKLPLITVEQLQIKKFKKNTYKEINFNNLISSKKTEDDHIEKIQYENDSQFEEPLQFHISDCIFNNSEYYQAEDHLKFTSLDLDKNDQINYISNNNSFENIGLEKQFISSLVELIGEVKVENPGDFEKQNINSIDILTEHQSLKNFDLIDNSLENSLLNLSYEINQELFKANLIKKMISEDSFNYLVGKKLMIQHPQPFVINFEYNLNQSSSNVYKLPNIIFFNISTVELEFKNLNLSIQKNKINELKNQFQRLIKKETYWRQKEITLNRIH